jgi:hypothetical protein
MTRELTGGCLCGAVRYRVVAEPTWVGHCHCNMCRRASGAPFVTWFTVASTAVIWEHQQPVRIRSSPIAQRGHCMGCGAQIAWQALDQPDSMDLTVATLDDPGAVRPVEHLYWADRMPGLELRDTLPRRRKGRASPLA